jgi:5-methylthioadenosine/S-adenosylhomocysteine deaminase
LKQSNKSEHFGAGHVWNMASKAAAPIASSSGYQGTIAVGAPADLLFVENGLALSPLIETPGFSNVAYNIPAPP